MACSSRIYKMVQSKQIIMQHLFLPYNLALIAKEKGFNEPCLGVYDKEHRNHSLHLLYTSSYKKFEEMYSLHAPLYQQIIDWFREKHNIHISVKSDLARSTAYQYIIETHSVLNKYGNLGNSYYEALNKAIEEAFKLI